MGTRLVRVVVGVVMTGLGAACAAGGLDKAAGRDTTTPIKHLVVIFDENVSFDHSFATCPTASNAEASRRLRAHPRPRASMAWAQRC